MTHNAINQVSSHVAGVITATNDFKRKRVFCTKALLEILEEPVRLVPG